MRSTGCPTAARRTASESELVTLPLSLTSPQTGWAPAVPVQKTMETRAATTTYFVMPHSFVVKSSRSQYLRTTTRTFCRRWRRTGPLAGLIGPSVAPNGTPQRAHRADLHDMTFTFLASVVIRPGARGVSTP